MDHVRFEEERKQLQGLRDEVAGAVEPPSPPTPDPIPTRTPIKGGEWVITIQLEVNDDVCGDPLVLHFADSVVAGSKGSARGRGSNPQDVGYLISRALHQRATQLKPGRAKR